MKKFFTLVALLCCCICRGQNYDKVWAFGDSAGIDFNTTPPVGITTGITGYEGTASISDRNGQLLFYTEGKTAWNRNHAPMPNGTGLMAGNNNYSTTTQQAAIANVPGSEHLYYIFSLDDDNNTVLSYSKVDMNLNSGLGDVLPGQKAIRLDSVFAEKMLLVPGNDCDIWLILRALGPGQGCYKSFRITAAGINPVPVISMVGSFSTTDYQYGYLIASPNRHTIAAAVRGAELYDFNASTGVLSNPRLLPGPPSNGFYYGLCFSPDNSKLYGANAVPGIDQFDLSQPTLGGIIASKINITSDFCRGMRLGPNGKIYIPRELSTTMKSIETPNLAGAACQYLSNAVQLTVGTENIIGMPNYNAVVLRDSVSKRHVRRLCGGNVSLSPFNYGIDHLWENGSTAPVRLIDQPGTYVLRYRLLCTSFTDTFVVLPKPVFPAVSLVQGNCSGQQTGKIQLQQQTNDTTTYHYTWYDAGNNMLQQNTSVTGNLLYPALQGEYQVKISTADSCDTLISVIVPELAAPVSGFESGKKCAGEQVRFTNTSSGSGNRLYWNFGDGTTGNQEQPGHTYNAAGTYRVLLVAANDDCSDTAWEDITIHELELLLNASAIKVDFNEPFTLQTSAGEPYVIDAWMPQILFPDQQATTQILRGDSTRTYTVTGHLADHQCIDTASISVMVDPILRFPSAFSPNGDGRNDYFKPVLWGSDPGVKRLVIYDRWGKKVWSASGQQALDGWDGTHANGGQAAIATYYWYLELMAPLKGQKIFKGDITLLH